MKRAAKGGALQAVTANALDTGGVVFQTRDGSWAASIDAAAVAADGREADALLARALADAGRNIVVEPYLIDVVREGERLTARVLREAIRTSGPTIVENAVVPPLRVFV